MNFEEDIIRGLHQIDDNYVNMPINEIQNIIDKLTEIAKDNQSETWQIFLQSELDYYKRNVEDSMRLTLLAHNMDKQEKRNLGQKPNYYIINSLAVSYYSIGKIDEAISCYLKTIEIKPDFYQAYLDLSTIYRNLRKYDCALECLNKIPDIKNTNLYYDKVEAKGRLYIEKQQFNKANSVLKELECLKNNDAEYLEALALSYIYINNYEKAEKIYNKALEVCQNIELKKYIENKKEALSLLRETDISETSSIKLILELPTEENEIIGKVLQNMRNQLSIVTNYNNMYKKAKSNRHVWEKQNYILCLKGWSSSTPEISLGTENELERSGGGFFIRYANMGIVIDPGINYLENFHANNLFIQDINIVIVTHNHIDHNNDLGKILDMSYQFKTTIYYYIDIETYAQYQKSFEQIEAKSTDFVRKIYVDSSNNEIVISKKAKTEIRLIYTPTKHNCTGSYGFKIKINNSLVIGYTSDTGYTDEIGCFFKDSNIIIANISEINREDLLLQKLKNTHLGIYGVYKLLDQINGDNVICLLSEFYGGFGDIRLEMADIIRRYLNEGAAEVIPMDIGMVYLLDSNAFVCNNCKKEAIKKHRNIIRFTEKTPRLYCLCDSCTLT